MKKANTGKVAGGEALRGLLKPRGEIKAVLNFQPTTDAEETKVSVKLCKRCGESLRRAIAGAGGGR